MKPFKIGSDPEFLLQDEEGNIVSSIGVVGGSKEEPRKLSKCSVHEDNVTMELTIDPSESEDEFVKSIKEAIEESTKEIGYSVSNKTSHEFSNEELDHPTAREAGCSTDMDALFTVENPIPELGSSNNRSCGGHLHFDLDDDDDLLNFVLTLDALVAVPSVIVDNDTIRRNFYGRASSFRPTRYGVEYRTLSNFWCFNEAYMRYVYKQSELALEKSRVEKIPRNVSLRAREIINNHNKEEAIKFCKDFNINIPE